MISLILTGHGHIASGMQEAITQVLGAQNDLYTIDFPEGVSTEQLEAELKQQVAQCQGELVFLTDLLGGSPFRIASLIAQSRPGTQVVAGMNLAMFAEILIERDGMNSAEECCNSILQAGRSGITSLAERLARQKTKTETADEL